VVNSLTGWRTGKIRRSYLEEIWRGGGNRTHVYPTAP